MQKKTDLEKVKMIARALLMTEIHETEFSPAVVQHPFTSSGITVLPRDGVFQLGNICSSESDIAAWREYMKKQIGNATCAYHIYMMTNKPYGLTFLKYTSPFLSKEEFSKILSDAWARSENPNSDPNFTQKELVSMFKQADPTILMDQAERKRLAELEDTVTVYRGVTSLNADNIRAMSWTLDKEVAEWFAHRYKEDGTVYEAEINKKYILALFMERNESEVVVDPKYLQNIEELQEQGIQQVQN